MIREAAKVMQNNTICIPKKIRKELNLKPQDMVIITYSKNKVILEKAPTSWHDLIGISKDTFKALGGGEKFIAEERSAWNKKRNS